MSELLFGFRDLTNIRDPKRQATLNIGSLIMNDEYVRKFSPQRYAFYVKFLTGLSNPSNLYRFLYKTNESKIYHEELANKISKVSNGLKNLTPTEASKVITNLRSILKDNKYEDLISAIESKKRTGGNPTYRINKPSLPMENLISDINKVYPLIAKVPPKSIDDIVINDMGESENQDVGEDGNITKVTKKDTRTPAISEEKVSQIKSIYEKYKNISQFSPDRLNITFIDRCIFIGVTFMLRLVSLSLVYWGLNSNLINNFRNAFVYYCLIYILFFTFIIGLVNIKISILLMKLLRIMI
jgi:hypothetical protein